MKLQQNSKNKNYFLYIPEAVITKLSLKKGDNVSVLLTKTETIAGESIEIQ